MLYRSSIRLMSSWRSARNTLGPDASQPPERSTPMFFVETLADLEKEVVEGSYEKHRY